MKLSGNRLIESIVGIRAKQMIHANVGPMPFAKFSKPANQAIFALITTAGVHLKTQPVFDVEAGDSTARIIPRESEDENLMISHTHFDRSDADQDINCVFPLTRLKELAAADVIGSAAPSHYGLMGYIPNTSALINETIPLIIKRLQDEKVDAVILNPG